MIDENLEAYENAEMVSQLDFSHLTEDDFADIQYDDEDGTPYGMVQGVPVAINTQPPAAPRPAAPSDPGYDHWWRAGKGEPEEESDEVLRDMARGLLTGQRRAGEGFNQTLEMLGWPVDLAIKNEKLREAKKQELAQRAAQPDASLDTRLASAIAEFGSYIPDPIAAVSKGIEEGLRYFGLDSDSPPGGSESIRDGLNAIVSFGSSFIPDDIAAAGESFAAEKPKNPLIQSIVNEITRFGLQAVGPAMYLRAFTVMTPFARGLAWGGIADFINAEPDEESAIAALTKYVSGATEEERGAFANAVLLVVERNENHPEIINKAKIALDGMIIGGGLEKGLEGIILAVRVIRSGALRQAIVDAGAGADQRLSGMRDTLSANPVSGGVDVALSAAGRLAGRQPAPEVHRVAKEAKKYLDDTWGASEEPNRFPLDLSTNREGGHSAYLRGPFGEIRISDHPGNPNFITSNANMVNPSLVDVKSMIDRAMDARNKSILEGNALLDEWEAPRRALSKKSGEGWEDDFLDVRKATSKENYQARKAVFLEKHGMNDNEFKALLKSRPNRVYQKQYQRRVGLSVEDTGSLKMPRRKALVPSDDELKVIYKVSADSEQAQIAVDTIARIRGRFPVGTGKEKFVPFEVTGGSFKVEGDKVTFIPQTKEISYNISPPKGVDPKKWQSKLANGMVTDVKKIVARAQSGDAKAIAIIKEATWYRSMRTALRREFGGMGDLFADLLGATSAKTVVRDNFSNSIDIIRQFSRGDFDAEIAAWEARVAAGESMNPVVLQQLRKAGEFPLISKASGVLYNSNSPAATKALFDIFRVVKAQAAPKTINFTGNLIGYSNDATIDVWAARYLRSKTGQPYIPLPAEAGVTGTHSVKSTLENPIIGGDFGFGQKVFQQAADRLNRAGIITGFDPTLGQIGADDLQAIVWFMEKEKWTAKGWTTKAGEGGSLDFEMALAGSADPASVAAARKAAGETFEPPSRRKNETDAQYDSRVQDAASAHEARVTTAEVDIDNLAAPLDRTVLGLSGERAGKTPSNFEQAEMAAELDDVVRSDPSVIAYKVTNTRGRFMKTNERSLDAEYVTRSDFDDAPLTRRLIEVGMDKDQEAVYISRVLHNPAEGQGNPGIELYFKKKQSVDFTQDFADEMQKRGIDGFTFITDARQADRINVQARAGGAETAGITGLRVQYIPEFESAVPTAARRKEMEDIFDDLAFEYAARDGISAANVVYYDTKVYRRKTGTGWMSGGQTYEEGIKATDRAAGSQTGRQKQPLRPDAPGPTARPGARATPVGP